MMQLVVIEEGGIACDAGCPYYEEGGVVQCHGGPKKSHCLAIMEPWSFDCDKFNPKKMWKGKTLLTPKEISQRLGTKLQKQRKLYDPGHAEIHPTGWRPGKINN